MAYWLQCGFYIVPSIEKQAFLSKKQAFLRVFLTQRCIVVPYNSIHNICITYCNGWHIYKMESLRGGLYMDKRYQVFVSSTFEDLQEERREVMQALLELDCIPAGMELFPASSEDQWSLIKRVINDCDYYLLIIAGRYGSINNKGISYTQMEFEYALSIGKPIVAFLHKNPDKIESGKTEKTAKGKKLLEEFRNMAKKNIVRFWETPVELGSIVSRSMVSLIKNFPSEGWVKLGSVVDEKSIKEIARLQNENNSLKEQLNALKIQIPAGTEKLEQGDDIFLVDFYLNSWSTSKQVLMNEKLTWNEIFGIVAPHLIGECSEFDMESALEEFIKKKISLNKKDSQFYCNITKESFGKIKVQLKALGLIRLSEKKHAGANKIFWTLSPYGDHVMTQLLARPKNNL